MTVTQTSAGHHTSGEIRCPYCNNTLPAYATFCGSCGKRVEQDAHTPRPENSSERYRVTTLVGRHPYIQLFLAMDTLFQRPVTLCDITVSSLSEEKRTQAFEAIQQEYEQLRHLRIPGLTPVIDLRTTPEHVIIVGGWPFPLPETPAEGKLQTHTLEGVLQSGIGLPDELIALTWVLRLCAIVSELHHSSIVVGSLDPTSIVVNEDAYSSQPVLMVSWLPQKVRLLLPVEATNLRDPSHFNAPETTQHSPEPRSDLYSLGAILYLLLTGTAPSSEASWQRIATQKLRERSPRLSKGTEELVLRTLSPNPLERFQSADEMSEALQQNITSIKSKRQGHTTRGYPHTTGERGESASDTGEATVSVVPIRTQLTRLHLSLQDTRDMSQDVQAIAAHIPAARLESGEDAGTSLADDAIDAQALASSNVSTRVEDLPTTPVPNLSVDTPRPEHETSTGSEAKSPTRPSTPTSRSQSLRQRITGILPAFPKRIQPRTPATQADLDASSKPVLLAWLQRFVIGEHQQRITSAALIEMPLRVQPDQGYTIRIHLMGRDAPVTTKGTKKDAQAIGLSALKKDEIVHIEVRSAIYQNYAYIVQRADVHLPGAGFAAEVTIPMQPLSSGQNGRRERLHIFFMDELRQPLYERPFVIEILVSNLVQAGKEGHNVLSVPV